MIYIPYKIGIPNNTPVVSAEFRRSDIYSSPDSSHIFNIVNSYPKYLF